MSSRSFVVVVLGMVFLFAAAGFADEASVQAVWQDIKTYEKQLEQIIADKKIGKVHELAFAIRDLVNALPGKSGNLSADELAKVKSYAQYVAVIAGRLDESGDAGNQAGTEANFKKLHSLVNTIKDQYPKDHLKEHLKRDIGL